MSRLRLCTLALAGTMSAVAAQSSFVLPKHFTKNQDYAWQPYMLPVPRDLPIHLQHSYDTRDFPRRTGVIQEIAFRPYIDVPAGTTTMTVRMGFSPLAPGKMSPIFAKNLAERVQTVFTGTVNWPKVQRGEELAPFTHRVPLTQRYAFALRSSRTFVVDYVITASSFQGLAVLDAGWPFFQRGPGPPTFWQPKCRLSSGRPIDLKRVGSAWVGHRFHLLFEKLPARAPVMWTFSAFGRSRRGPWPLPIDLKPLGAANCTWDVGLEFGAWIPTVVTMFGYACVSLGPLPWELAGLRFFEQALVVDPKANALGLVPGPSTEYVVGFSRGETRYALRDSAKSARGSSRGDTVVIQIR